MELKGSKTEKILLTAFTRELQANAKYKYFSAFAKEAGYEQIADIFLAMANNEAEHARHEFQFLGGIKDIRANLVQAIRDEHEEAAILYPKAVEEAEKEGFTEIAKFFSRMGNIEKKHEKQFLELLKTLDEKGTFTGRTVGHSAADMAQVMLPHQANVAGFIHGGELMKLMDNAASVVAERHSRANVVTGTVEDISFHNAVRVGDLVFVHGRITFTSHSSMEVRIEVEAENLLTGGKLQALTAYFIMVGLDNEGKPMEVPPLILSTEEEESLHSEAMIRYESRKMKLKSEGK